MPIRKKFLLEATYNAGKLERAVFDFGKGDDLETILRFCRVSGDSHGDDPMCLVTFGQRYDDTRTIDEIIREVIDHSEPRQENGRGTISVTDSHDFIRSLL